jgi:hypothetical protein
MLKDEIEKKIKKEVPKNNPSQRRLTHQTNDLGHGTIITS